MRAQPWTMRTPGETVALVGFCRHCGARVVRGPRLQSPHLTLMAGHLRSAHPEVLSSNPTPPPAVLVAQFRFQTEPLVLHPPPAVECRGDPVSRDAA